MTADPIQAAKERLTKALAGDRQDRTIATWWENFPGYRKPHNATVADVTTLLAELSRLEGENERLRIALDAETIDGVLGYCRNGGGCVCGGDVPEIRAMCGNWAALAPPSTNGGEA